MGIDTMQSELLVVGNLELRKLAGAYLEECVPVYFYTVAASSSGKYHPKYTLGEGGLVRHTKAAVALAECLLGLEQNSTLNMYHDEIIVALIIHDTFKHGLVDRGHTEFNHPNIAARKFKEFAEQKQYPNMTQIDMISDLVRAHMGQWNTSKYSNVVLDKPFTKEQQFVHMCDYLASRQYITVEV
mgnify:CR=1 FL=1